MLVLFVPCQIPFWWPLIITSIAFKDSFWMNWFQMGLQIGSIFSFKVTCFTSKYDSFVLASFVLFDLKIYLRQWPCFKCVITNFAPIWKLFIFMLSFVMTGQLIWFTSVITMFAFFQKRVHRVFMSIQIDSIFEFLVTYLTSKDDTVMFSRNVLFNVYLALFFTSIFKFISTFITRILQFRYCLPINISMFHNYGNGNLYNNFYHFPTAWIIFSTKIKYFGLFNQLRTMIHVLVVSLSFQMVTRVHILLPLVIVCHWVNLLFDSCKMKWWKCVSIH